MNILVDESLDGKRLLWLGFSDCNPGAYYLFDKEKRAIKALGVRMNWISRRKWRPCSDVKYAARDGLVIHGYLDCSRGP